jgi:thymidine kinase
MDRDVTRTIELRYKIITEWKAAGADFQKNCVFIDEAGFNSHQIRSRAWSVKGTPAQV